MFKLSPDAHFFNRASAAIISPLQELLKSRKLDVFEMEESVGCSLTVSRLNLLPVVVRLHGPWFLSGASDNARYGSFQDRRREEREGLGIQNAQIVTAPSAAVLQAVKEHYQLTLPTSRVIPNPLQSVVKEKTWSIDKCNKNSILFVGRFDRTKGADLVLRVFGELAASDPALTLTFVGPDTGIMQPDGTKWSFEYFIERTLPDWCRSRIEFHGQIGHPEVMALRARHFLTIVASPYEAFGYSALEAMSVGSPIIATAGGGISELVQHERNGLLVPPNERDTMVNACKRLFNDRSLAVRLGEQAWLDCRALYGPDTIAKQTIAAYEEAVYKFTCR